MELEKGLTGREPCLGRDSGLMALKVQPLGRVRAGWSGGLGPGRQEVGLRLTGRWWLVAGCWGGAGWSAGPGSGWGRAPGAQPHFS